MIFLIITGILFLTLITFIVMYIIGLKEGLKEDKKTIQKIRQLVFENPEGGATLRVEIFKMQEKMNSDEYRKEAWVYMRLL